MKHIFQLFPQVCTSCVRMTAKSNSTQRKRMHAGRLHLPHENKAPSQKKRRGVPHRRTLCSYITIVKHLLTCIINPPDNINSLKEEPAVNRYPQSVHCNRPSMMCILSRQPPCFLQKDATNRKTTTQYRLTVAQTANVPARCFYKGRKVARLCVFFTKAEQGRLVMLLLPTTVAIQLANRESDQCVYPL